ncbi:Granzyme B [Triplophysa tibetana]|uniref:trypsin n=1 Tax=Triplophysa tibetana TaxID=1572043 RepID=A0A5A9P4P6_9TELE|nr:Granzyme B [Triplophysa tibetana]
MFLRIFLLFCISFAVGMESGIIGGNEAKPHSRPYLASLQHNKAHTCGGMLIKENYVLTSAHCLKDISGKKQLEVVLGAHNIDQNERSQQRIQVIKYIPHPGFEQNNNKNYSYDIMLLKLKTKAKLNKFVKVVTLPNKYVKTPGHGNCSIAGWGMINKDIEKPSSILYEVTLELQSNEECKTIWQTNFDSARQMCTVSNGREAFCMGDSGSPLICERKLLGIASYTSPDYCTKTIHPEVYVKIPAFFRWIKKHT